MLALTAVGVGAFIAGVAATILVLWIMARRQQATPPVDLSRCVVDLTGCDDSPAGTLAVDLVSMTGILTAEGQVIKRYAFERLSARRWRLRLTNFRERVAQLAEERRNPELREQASNELAALTAEWEAMDDNLQHALEGAWKRLEASQARAS